LYEQALVGAHPAGLRLRLLDDHATGQALSQLRERFSRLHASGYVVRGPIGAELRSQVSVQGPTAVIDVCVDASKVRRYDAKTHEPIDRSGRPLELQRVTLRKVGGIWKMAMIAVLGRCKRR
jgi:hypothetical protein